MSEVSAARAAVEQLVNDTRADTGGDQPLVVTEFVIVAAAAGWNEDGDRVTAVTIIPEGADHQVLGLLESARIRFQAGLVEFYGQGGDL